MRRTADWILSREDWVDAIQLGWARTWVGFFLTTRAQAWAPTGELRGEKRGGRVAWIGFDRTTGRVLEPGARREQVVKTAF